MAFCKKCARELTSDEIGLYRRLIHRGAAEFLCLTCLAAHYGVDEESLREKIEHFRAQGCTLFL